MPFFTISTQRNATQPLIIPNQQMNLGGKWDKPVGNGNVKLAMKALKSKQIRLGMGTVQGRINRIRHVNKSKTKLK